MTVFLDNNGNGLLDTGEPSTVTGNDGAYRVVGDGPRRLAVAFSPAEGPKPVSKTHRVIRGAVLKLNMA